MSPFKKKEIRVPSNYSPLSLTSAVNKVSERFILGTFTTFVLENTLLNKNQSDFVPGHSTSIDIISVLYGICCVRFWHKV